MLYQNEPALRVNLLSSLFLRASQVFELSQSSLPQQHIIMEVGEGSGEGTREKLAKATVNSSIVEVASWRLLVRGDSGDIQRRGGS
jgi:hypothetical protein